MSNSKNTVEIVTTSNVIRKEAFTIKDRIELIVDLDTKLLVILREMKDNNWDSLKDSRMLFFRNIIELNSNTILQFAFQAEAHELTKDKNWLKERLPHLTEEIDKVSDMDNYSSNRNNNISG